MKEESILNSYLNEYGNTIKELVQNYASESSVHLACVADSDKIVFEYVFKRKPYYLIIICNDNDEQILIPPEMADLLDVAWGEYTLDEHNLTSIIDCLASLEDISWPILY